LYRPNYNIINCAVQAGFGTIIGGPGTSAAAHDKTRTTAALGYSVALYVITISSAPKLIHRRKSVRVLALEGVPQCKIDHGRVGREVAQLLPQDEGVELATDEAGIAARAARSPGEPIDKLMQRTARLDEVEPATERPERDDLGLNVFNVVAAEHSRLMQVSAPTAPGCAPPRAWTPSARHDRIEIRSRSKAAC
jgi:hypothetical protein